MTGGRLPTLVLRPGPPVVSTGFGRTLAGDGRSGPRRKITDRIRVRASLAACRAALLLDGREVSVLTGNERIVDVAAVGERRPIRAVEIARSSDVVYRWVSPAPPFVEERFAFAPVDERTTEVRYDARIDPLPGALGRLRSTVLLVRLRRAARLRLEGLRALVGSRILPRHVSRRLGVNAPGAGLR
jgi:hypothetical protein